MYRAVIIARSENACLTTNGTYDYVLPYMASLIAKKKANKLYYYLVESGRVDGKPRITHQTYLGSAERVAALVQDRTAPLPLSATFRDLGLPFSNGSSLDHRESLAF
jgi:hypothetical protein